MTEELDSHQKDSLERASKAKLEQVFQGIAGNLNSLCWLDQNNVYIADCIQTLVNQTSQPGQFVNDNNLSEYIAASAPLHCMDGWALVGRAFDAHIRGDVNTAIHVAYYAELRAAMSLLAAEGIGIFDDRHFVVTSSGICEPFGKVKKNGSSTLRTHKITWLALEHWSTLTRSSDLFRLIIKPGGIPLGDWIDAFGVSTNSSPITARWLKAWGLDLRRLSAGEDRDARNQSSYRPTFLNHGGSLTVFETSSFMRELWNMYEPSIPSRFDVLDRYLLRLILEESSSALPQTKGLKYGDRVSKMLTILFTNISVIKGWEKFLLRNNEPGNPLLFTEAASSAKISDPRHHLQIISRAALLLRVATGACQELLKGSSFGRTELEFWWRPLGNTRGLWDEGDEPMNFTDLWEDIDMAIQDLDNWETTNNNQNTCYSNWRRELAHQISLMGEHERIALWGLGL